jgi:hypothetical protein
VFLDSEDEGEKKALNEVDGPCCAIKELGLPIEEEGEVPEDETLMHAENTKVLEVTAQEEENEFSNVSNPACYDTDSDTVDNIDEFIHVGRRRWDIVGYDLDPIYDTESHFQLLPLHLSQ